ncbi:hypothetical protein N9B73_11365 [Verrucomicrobiales bacterium]|nr:hypothetical protein [Verrucomicrobiales bacterium]
MLGFTAPKAEALECDRLVNYAHALGNMVVKINVEIREHYSHTSVYRHMLAETHRLHAEAQHIDQLSHNLRTSLIHLRTDVIEVDKHVHHLHDLINAADQGRYGHVHGDTAMFTAWWPPWNVSFTQWRLKSRTSNARSSETLITVTAVTTPTAEGTTTTA